MNPYFQKDQVLRYMDEQICSRLHEKTKKSCQNLVDTNGRDLIKNIQQGMVWKIIVSAMYSLSSLATITSLYTFSSLS